MIAIESIQRVVGFDDYTGTFPHLDVGPIEAIEEYAEKDQRRVIRVCGHWVRDHGIKGLKGRVYCFPAFYLLRHGVLQRIVTYDKHHVNAAKELVETFLDGEWKDKGGKPI